MDPLGQAQPVENPDNESLLDNTQETDAEVANRLRDELSMYHLASLNTTQGTTKAKIAKAACTATAKLVKKLIKLHVWRTVKFITNDQQLDSCINKIWEHMPSSQRNQATYEAKFKAQYPTLAASLLNQVRTDIVGAMKKSVHNYMLAHNGNMPSVDDIKKCAFRQINNREERELYVWYINDLLPKACGNKYQWPETKRYFERPSKYHFEGNPQKLMIPPSTEAFLVLAYDNNAEKWRNQWNFLQENRGRKCPKPRKKKDRDFSEEDEAFVSKWTSSDEASTIWGGWAEDSVLLFKTLCTEVRNARAGGNCQTVENVGMVDLRQRSNITVATEEEYMRSKKRRSTDTLRSRRQSVEFDEEI